jgi:glycosyltransferase involved in cell wall biosynthesis
MPTVSVLIPNYNRSHMLQDAIRSVLAQTYHDYEILVVDDGSAEDIPAALAPFGDRVRYARKENGGCASAKNYGLGLVTGEYIAVLDNDDLWLPAKLERQVDVLKRHPEVGMVSCQAFVMDEGARVLERPPQGSLRKQPLIGLSELAEQNVIVGGSSSEMVRTSALRAEGGFDTAIEFVDDWDCWLRLARRWQIWMIPAPLSYYRINSQGYRNHAPLPAKAGAVHANVQRVLERAFADWPAAAGDPIPAQARAYAHEYLRHALVLYAIGRCAEGRAAWEQAIASDAGYAADPATIKTAMLMCATGYAMGLSSEARSKQATGALSNILSDLPAPVRFLREQRADMEAALLAELAFLAAQQGDAAGARSFGLQCLVRDASWARNIGLLKLMLTGGRAQWPTPVQQHMTRFS